MWALKSILLSFVLFSQLAWSQKTYVPKDLKPWKNWVLEKHKKHKCPFNHQNGHARACTWPVELSVKVSSKGGNFNGNWKVFKEEYVLLPGGKEQWPLDVLVNGKKAIVANRYNRPALKLTSGDYNISGSFKWNKLPLRLMIPQDVGLLSLSVKNKNVLFPKFDENGDLWIKTDKVVKSDKADFLQVKLFRRLTDSIPMIDETKIRLNVGGKEREVSFSSPLLKDFIPMSHSSKLSLQWEKSGRLKVRVRPGKWNITLKSRGPNNITQLSPPIEKVGLPSEEIWVFQDRRKLRMVKVENVRQVDSQLLDIPRKFKGLPTYLMKKGDSMVLRETGRGKNNLGDDELKLQRTFWLDFEGKGFTVKDYINGTLAKNWRLEMPAPYELGSVSINNQNQLITFDKTEDVRGVEVRHGSLNLEAESRLKTRKGKISAVGWSHDFKNVTGTLHIPPGWKTLALLGTDYSRGTWISKWSLLTVFFVLIITMGVAKLRDIKWATVCFFALVLLTHESQAPYKIWLVLLVIWALVKALTGKDKVMKYINIFRYICLAVLVWISFPFIINQIQHSLYPSLERGASYGDFYSNISSYDNYRNTPGRGGMIKKVRKIRKAKAMPKKAASFGGLKQDMKMERQELLDEDIVSQSNIPSSAPSYAPQEQRQQIDPNALIQTGPGVPNWSWGTINFGWEGPVKKNQNIRLVALSPGLNRLLTLVRIALLLLLIFCFFDIKKDVLFKPERWNFIKFLFLLGLFSIPIEKGHAQNFPSPELLTQLEERLTKQADCLPNCSSLSKLSFSYNENSLTLRMRIHVLEDSYLSLPGQREQWYPKKVVLASGLKLALRSENGLIQAFLPKGQHDLLLKGPFPDRDVVQINLPMLPRFAEAKGSSWSVEGIRNSGKVENTIEFTRTKIQKKSKKRQESFEDSVLPSFVRVRRSLYLGLNWQVTTSISRRTPTGQAITLKIPLLPGETVTSSNIQVKDGIATVYLKKYQKKISWSSVLKEASSLELKASESLEFIEQWNVEYGPIWNVNYSGLPVIKLKNNSDMLAPNYQPWPGEKLTLNISRPKGAKGKSITLNEAQLTIAPGKRLTDNTLDLKFTTSLGSIHNITLLDGVDLRSVTINGSKQSLSLQNSKLALPLGVGKQHVIVKWQKDLGVKTVFKTPKVDLGIKGINLKIQVKMSSKRWIMALGGPLMGPAVLFWGKLFGLLILAFVLSQLSWIPLKFYHWALLALGLTQGYNLGIFIVLGYLVFISYRKQIYQKLNKFWYNTSSLLFMGWTAVTISTFLYIIQNGLLGGPKMGIQGNRSTAYILNWFVDFFELQTPTAWVFSLPTWVYQVLMLVWAIWMTFSIISWTPWIWEGLYGEGLFKKLNFYGKKKEEVKKEETENKN